MACYLARNVIAVRAFFVGLREVFTLAHAEEQAHGVAEGDRLARQRRAHAARKRRDAARTLADPIPAIVLLRDALGIVPSESKPELAIDDMAFADAEVLRTKLDDRLTELIRSNEIRGVTAVRALRLGRPLAMVLLIALPIAAFVHTHFRVHNLAVGKVVTTSALRSESPTPSHVVDGRTRGTFGVHTAEAEHPFVIIDLGEAHVIDHVVVYDRGDGWFDECLPLRVELSNDGATFDVIGLRTEHFVSWVVAASGRTARFVRISKPDRGYIALNEIEVYGR
jgi:hypothetical protein